MWLLVGGDSEVGAATLRVMRGADHEVIATTRRTELVGTDRPLLDLEKPLDQWRPPPQTSAVCIFAAVARLAACEKDPAASAHINVTQTLALIDKLTAAGIYVLHLSTNQVFDGRTPRMPPEAPTCPVSEYGRQKARAEASIRERLAKGAPAAVLRLAKVISADTPLLGEWVKTLSAGGTIRPFHDMTMAPTPVDLVVRAITLLMDQRATGFFQLTGPRDVSYAEIGYYLAERLRVDKRQVAPVSATTMNLARGAAPPYTTLDSTELCIRLGVAVPDPFKAVDMFLTEGLVQIG